MLTAKDIIRTNYISGDVNDRLSSLIGKLIKVNEPQAVVLSNNTVIGIFYSQLILKSRVNSQQAKLDKFTKRVPILTENTELLEIARLMYESNAVILPVVKNEKLIGIVHFFDLVYNMKDVLSRYEVHEIRHPRAIIILEKDRIGKAIKIMNVEKIYRLPVVNNKNELIGTLSHFEIMEKLYLESSKSELRGQRLKGTKSFSGEIEKVMSLPVQTFMNSSWPLIVSEKDNGEKIAEIFIENKVYSVLIMDDKCPRYIVTKRDLLEAIIKPSKEVLSNVQFVDFKKLSLDIFTKSELMKTANNFSKSISYTLRKGFNIKVHIIVSKNSFRDKKKKYNVRLHLTYTGDTITVDKAQSWDVKIALKNAFHDLENKLSNEFKLKK